MVSKSRNNFEFVTKYGRHLWPADRKKIPTFIAALRERGIYLPRWRVREAIVRVDPIGRANRWGQRIVRRPYCVPHSNFLWHIDTNMKLRHWRLCIHGCVDGYSRLITYLKVNTNNRAVTVLECFQRATREWGTPSRVRADAGGENVAIGEYMVWLRGENREARRLLDPSSDTDMFFLHFVFIPRIQRLLERFSQRLNVHSLSTEHNRTPRQLWVSG